MSNNQGSYAALFQLETALAKEHCRTKLSQIKMIGRDLHQQVRIEFPTANGTTSAIYTVSTVHNGEPDLVFLGEKIQDELNNCQEHSNIHTCIGEVKAQVPFEGLTDEQAEACGEFIERLSHNGQNHKLVVIAPHGGEIEAWTDKQAEYIGNQFSSEHVSLWICKGFNKGNDSALKRWHITSTDISEKSFPKLNTIFGPKFEYSIAFHGWTKDSICVGGSKNQTPPNLKERIKNAIQETLLAKGSDIQVNNSDSPEGCPEGFNGDKDENIVNRLGTNGIQIEQCMKAREKYHDDIAQAVADAIRPWINM